MAATALFYESLPEVDRFADLSDPSVYRPLPEDWSVAVSDVKDSTGHIEQGRYKQVNLIGASTIMALLNLERSLSIPFIFGGDGAAVCIPPSLVPAASSALLAVQELARSAYGMELRIGIVPVSFIRSRGHDVLVARSRLSATCTQAAFTGGGLSFAEECLKDPAVSGRFSIDRNSVRPEGDFTGLECRWQNVKSAHEEIVSLIVQATADVPEERNAVYRDVVAAIGTIYGDDAECHPVREEMLTMSMREKELAGESAIRSFGKGTLYRVRYWFHIRWKIVLGKILMGTKTVTAATDWGGYKRRLINNTDFKKFDDKIRQILSGSAEQRIRLAGILERLRQERKLVYGIHTAPHALITCLLFDYSDAHIHLVDADGGGYAVAARQLKEQLTSL